MTEKQIETSILTYLFLRNDVRCRKEENQGTYDAKKGIYRKRSRFKPKGVSDITGHVIGTGQAIYIEVKGPTGRLTPEQARFLKQADEDGAIAFMARCIEHVEQEFRKHGLKPRLK